MNNYHGQQRIVWLTGETAETPYSLGEDLRIVGISGFTSHPKEALQKPKVSRFMSAKIERILELQPDLVIGFSKLQAQIAHDLIQIRNRRIRLQPAIRRRCAGSHPYSVAACRRRVSWARARRTASQRACAKNRGIRAEISAPATGLFRGADGAAHQRHPLAGQTDRTCRGRRHFSAPSRRARRKAPDGYAGFGWNANPEVILASWCSRKVDKDKTRAREGWDAVEPVPSGHVYEVGSNDILQPVPASLTEGARQLHAILARIVDCAPADGLEPSEPLDPDFASSGTARVEI